MTVADDSDTKNFSGELTQFASKNATILNECVVLMGCFLVPPAFINVLPELTRETPMVAAA
jgi:hypothetical protein